MCIRARSSVDPEDRDEYLAENVFWVPREARWEYLQASAKQPEIGKKIDDAMVAIERENPSLKGVLSKDYARPAIDKTQLGELIDLMSTIAMGDAESRSKDLLGRVYEYFLGRFASAEGKGGGEFYTARCVVKLLVEMLEPFRGRVYDPCCGSGGMFVQSEEFVKAHGGSRNDLAIYGQEYVGTTWKLAKMNLALRGIEADLGDHSDDSFHRDLHPDLRADFILANPPFNMDDWHSDAINHDPRWKYGTPPSNANFAWVQHFVHHLAPNGRAGFVLANMALSSDSAAELAIRKGMVDDNIVDCIVTLPDKLFFTTPIAASLWFLDKSRTRNSRDEILFIDASALFSPITRTLNTLSPDHAKLITEVYLSWRAGQHTETQDGFARPVQVSEVQAAGYGLLP